MCSLPRRNCNIDTFAVHSLEMLQKMQNGSIARRNSKFAQTIVLVNEKTVILQQDNARPHKTTGTQQVIYLLEKIKRIQSLEEGCQIKSL
jgi:hypothetical protein